MLFTVIFVMVTGYLVTGIPLQNAEVGAKWCNGNPADIFFLIDSSSSIWNVHFRKQLEFVANVTDMFPISSDQTRVGVGTFSAEYHHEISFSHFDNSKALMKNIKTIRQRYGSTKTAIALKAVRVRELQYTRPGVPHIVVVMTDGNSRNPNDTIKEASLLKAKGVHVFAIGIGDGPSMQELMKIGSEPSENYVYSVSSFEVLKSLKSKLAYKTCQVLALNEQPRCSAKTKTDLIFAFDGVAMGTRNVRKVNSFVGEVATNFGNMEDGTLQVGVMAGTCTDRNIHLNKYRMKTEFVGQVMNMDVKGLDQIVRELHEHSFNETMGGRLDARHIAVIVVDENVEKMDEILLQILRARQMDIEVFVVAIGEQINLEALSKAVSQPSDKHLFPVPSYEALESIQGDFSKLLCDAI